MLADGFPTLPDFDAMETGEATKEDVYATQDIIAHVQKTLKADKAYTSGESFIYNGVLYHATASIAKDADIVLTGESANATTSSAIQIQIGNTLKNNLSVIQIDNSNYTTYLDSFDTTLFDFISSKKWAIVKNANVIKVSARVRTKAAISTYSKKICNFLPATGITRLNTISVYPTMNVPLIDYSSTTNTVIGEVYFNIISGSDNVELRISLSGSALAADHNIGFEFVLVI